MRISTVDRTDNGFQIIINNPTDIPFKLTTAAGNDPSLEVFTTKTLPSGKQTIIKIQADDPTSINKIDLNVIVDNLLVAPDTGLNTTLSFIVD